MFRMMRISQKKKEFAVAGGYKFKYTFFDVVFDIIRVKKYEAKQHAGSHVQVKNTVIETMRSNFDHVV